MKEEYERPKIKLKMKQVEDESSSNSFVEQENLLPQSESAWTKSEEKKDVQKIIIHTTKNAEAQKNDEKVERKRSIFQITAIVLTILLVIAIVVEIGVMLWLKNNTSSLKNKNDKLPQTESSISAQI